MNTRTEPLPRRTRRRWIVMAIAAIAATVVLAIAVQQSLTAASADVPHTIATSWGQINGSVIAPSEADGVIREGDQPTVFDTDRAAIGNLNPDLLAALQRAATDAAADGVELRVNSGWRSAALQEKTLQDAIVEYGSEREARRWVATPQTSAHVSGDAVDLGPLATLDWMVQRGWRYGLCQTYANESWHYELRPEAVEQGCPRMYTDPTEDPRMQP